MEKVGIIGVGQSAFVRGYPGSVRELAFEAFKEASYQLWIKETHQTYRLAAQKSKEKKAPLFLVGFYLFLFF